MKKRILSLLCCAALVLTMIPTALAFDTVELNFDTMSVGDTFDGNDYFSKSDLPSGGIIQRTVKKDGDKQYLEMTCTNTADSTAAIRNRFRTKEAVSGTFTVEFDFNQLSATKLDVYLRQGGNVRITVQPNGTVMLQVLDAAKVPGVMQNASCSYKLEQGKWYTLKAEVTPEQIELTVYDKADGNKLKDSVVIGQDASTLAKLFDPYNIWFDMWGNTNRSDTTPVTLALDNILIQEGTYEGVKSEPTGQSTIVVDKPQAESVQLFNENFEGFIAGAAIRNESVYILNDYSNGGVGTRVAAKSGGQNGNTYYLATAWNTPSSTNGTRVQLKTVKNFGGPAAYTLEYDYNNVTAKRGQYYDVYLRQGGNVRVRIMQDGTARLLILSNATVPGVMESKDSAIKLDTNHWYTFKVKVSVEKITVEIYDKDNGNKLLETLTTGQDSSKHPQLFDPYPVWFDLWGDNDLTNLNPIAVAIDNVNVYSNTYEGLKNADIKPMPVVPVKDEPFAMPEDDMADCPTRGMMDVPQSAWYHDAVDYVVTNKLMNGVSSYQFGTYQTLTRAMVVQVLYNKEGQPAVSGAHGFADVPATQWYNNAVTWAAAHGIVSGYGNGLFKPDDRVTLEQVLVILWNYSGNPALTGDADAVGPHSDWAGNAIGWAQAAGVLENVPFDTVTAPATRAQTAQMLMNYIKQ